MDTLVRVLTLTLLFAVTVISPAAAATYGGDATGAAITVPATGTTIRAATGSLGISGGGADASLLVGDVPGSATGGVVALSAGVMHSSIVGLDATRAEASMGNVGLTISGNEITADFVMARSAASCGPAVTGSSELTNLVINGSSIVVTGAPNQTVTLPNGTVVINQQSPSIAGTSAELVVNALHVTTRDTITGALLADVLLATVDAKIDCAGGTPPSAQFTTGGGWIDGRAGGKATLGFVAGVTSGGMMGHLVYKDHDFPFSVQGTVITSMTSGCTGSFSGEGTDNTGAPVTFNVSVNDLGEPGRSDTFSISANGYMHEGTLRGGNIQAHGFDCR